MTLDIRGSLKNTKINQHYYAVVDELFSNSIDSYLIRKNDEPSNEGLEVTIFVEFFDKDLDGRETDLKIACIDNGFGMGDDQTKAFITKDTSYKDDLAIAGIGKCKGSGRIQFLHYFSKLQIDSTYRDDDKYKRRTLSIDTTIKEIDEKSFATKEIDECEISTTFILDIIKHEIYERLFADNNLKEKFSVESLRQHIMIAFLQRLVSLKDSLGKFTIKIKTKYKEQEQESTLVPEELPVITAQKEVNIFHKDSNGVKTDISERFSISHYKLDKAEFNLKRNSVALCAKSSAVKFITKRYLKTKTLENNHVNGFYHIILIESDYLDSQVNEQRDDFDMPLSSLNDDIFLKNLISLDEIYEDIDDQIVEMLSPPDWDKEEVVRNIENKYGISSTMVTEANVRIRYGDTEETIVKRVLSSYQEKIIKDTSDIFDIKEEISKAEPNSDDFRTKVNDLAWKYTSSLKSIDMANLSQVVVRRAAILEILHLAINKNLKAQDIGEDERREDEKIIHNIFFPMRKDSNEVEDHDIWILNEEYHYYDYISSDKPLSKIPWGNDKPLFENDIDEKLEEILKANYSNNSSKRPDIAIFNNEGSAIIIEFKSPGVSMDAHIGDLMEYAQLLAAKSNGKLKKFYGYLIGTNVNPNRLTGYTRFPSGQGWFSTNDVMEHSTGQRIGELYSEILDYNNIVDRAKKRLDVYKKRLNLTID